MHMKTPNEHHRKLALIAGTWKGHEKMHPSDWAPDGSVCDAMTVARVDLAAFVVVTDYEQQQNGQTTYSGHGVYTIEDQSNDVLLHWFDSMGSPAELFRGKWNGDVLTLESCNATGHSMRLVHDYSESGKLSTKGSMSMDGDNWSDMFDGKHVRQ